MRPDRRNFDKWFKQTWTSVKIPGKGTVYDYFVNPKTQKFQPWAELVTDIDYDGSKPMSTVFVPTAETSSLRCGPAEGASWLLLLYYTIIQVKR